MTDKTLSIHDRLGHFEIDNNRFFNRVDALSFSQGEFSKIHFNFNDDVYSKQDWQTPIKENLNELYIKRAQQLREKYDYVSLMFSGGVDSTNVLKIFIDNNILLDEIVMMQTGMASKYKSYTDKTCNNSYSEIYFAALPYLTKYLKDKRTKVRFINVDELTNNFLNNDSLIEQYRTSLGHLGFNSIAKIAMSTLDKDWNILYEKGLKVCHIQGTDKPWVDVDRNNGLYCSFRDSSTWKLEEKFDTSLSEMLNLNQHHECFYWTPDLPQIVIKQCQMIKQRFNTDEYFKKIVTLRRMLNNIYIDEINSMIYPQDVMSVQELFHTGKVSYVAGFSPNNWIDHSLNDKSFAKYDNLFRETFVNSHGQSNSLNGNDWRFYIPPPISSKKHYF